MKGIEKIACDEAEYYVYEYEKEYSIILHDSIGHIVACHHCSKYELEQRFKELCDLMLKNREKVK